jgi:hypothetical protein
VIVTFNLKDFQTMCSMPMESRLSTPTIS